MVKPAKLQNMDTDVASLARRANNIEDELDTLKADKAELYLEIKAAGISVKEFRAAVKFARKPLDVSFRQLVNANLSAMGQMELFKE